MGDFLSRLTIYDYLTTILLGGCLYLPLKYYGVIEAGFFCNSIIVEVAAIYLIGLLLNKLWEAIDFSSCINKRKDTKCTIRMAVLSLFCRNQKSLISRAADDVGMSHMNDIETKYLEAYYNAAGRNELGNIPKIEAHSALAKDLFFTLFFVFSVILCFEYKRIVSCGSIIFIVLLIASLIVLLTALCAIRYNSELKIHRLVWENKKYCASRRSAKMVVLVRRGVPATRVVIKIY